MSEHGFMYWSSSDEAESDDVPSDFDDPEIVDSNHSLAQLPSQEFHYSPLDHHKPSIRLIRIHPTRSPHGFLQCAIRHATTTTSSSYSFLSYVWGTKPDGSWILINGQRFHVRRNLFNFLTYARLSPQLTKKWLWIDALCIDQQTMVERNHQVQQMGQIYSQTEEVISWLGCSKRIAEFLDDASRRQLRTDRLVVFRDSLYWDRAWITQEVVLARRVLLMAKSSILDGELIPRDKRQKDESRPSILHPRTKDSLRGRSLIYLMDRIRYRSCSDPRDRIFSLTALCGDGSGIAVDYSKPNNVLAKDVLRACKQSFCLCAVGIVGSVLQLKLEEEREHNEPSKEPFAQIRIPGWRHDPCWQIYYTCLCGADGCDGFDTFHRYGFNNEQVLKAARFAVTVDMRYFCDVYRHLITFYVDANCNVIDFGTGLETLDHYGGFRLENRHGASALDRQDCVIHIPFYLLLRMTRIRLFLSDHHCARVSSPGTSTVVDSSAMLDIKVLDAGGKKRSPKGPRRKTLRNILSSCCLSLQ